MISPLDDREGEWLPDPGISRERREQIATAGYAIDANRFIEEKVRKHPEQWVWMHERWKTRPGEEVV